MEWLDVFTRNKYKDLLLESLEFCQKNKGMAIFAWCIMTNHVHLVFRTIEEHRPEVILR
ncbi:MAG: transposase [Owenweeksia sp.]|nr:transposase [Owenweeksia sp.]